MFCTIRGLLMMKRDHMGLPFLSILVVAALICLAPAAEGEEVTIRMAHWLGDPDHGSGLEMLMEAVEERIAPYGIKLETVVNSSSNYRDRVISQTIGGMGPDII